jgi:hypothetical protein
MRHITFYMVLAIAVIVFASIVSAMTINITTQYKLGSKLYYERMEESHWPEAVRPPEHLMVVK